MFRCCLRSLPFQKIQQKEQISERKPPQKNQNLQQHDTHDNTADSAKTQYNLAIMYKEGCGINQDKYEAIRLFRLAAKQGHVKAQVALDALLNS